MTTKSSSAENEIVITENAQRRMVCRVFDTGYSIVGQIPNLHSEGAWIDCTHFGMSKDEFAALVEALKRIS